MPDPKNNTALLEEKLSRLQQRRIIATDTAEQFRLDVEIEEVKDQMRSLNESAYNDLRNPDLSWQLQPINRSVLKQSIDFTWWQRLTFRWLSPTTLHRAALKATGVFEHNQINYYLSTTEGNMPVPFRTAEGKTGGNTVDHLVTRLGDAADKQRFYLLLGESGSGKSNVLFNAFYRLALQPKPRVLLLPVSEALDLDQLRLPDQEQTVRG